MKKKLSNISFDTDTFFIILFAVLAVVVFWVRYNEPAPFSDTSNTLFSFFEIVFSIGLGWFLQRKESTKQYEENLKKYALSAYRRISDIGRSVKRAKIRIEEYKNNADMEKLSELDVIYAIIEGTDDTVQSSISDWTDILNEEIKKKEEIEELIEEKNKLISEKVLSLEKANENSINEVQKELSNQIQAISNKIVTLKSELPQKIQTDIQDIGERPRSGRLSAVVLEYYMNRAIQEKKLVLEVILFDDNYFDDNYFDEVKNYTTIEFNVQHSLNKSVISVHHDNNQIGRVRNPFPPDPYVYNEDFIYTLTSLLGRVASKMKDPKNFQFSKLNMIYRTPRLINIEIPFEPS
jgi:hypothetical protein